VASSRTSLTLNSDLHAIMNPPIPFNKPFLTGQELEYMSQAAACGQLSGDGKFTHAATEYLNRHYLGSSSLITHSCTAALEMSALLLEINSGDRVVCPSYTFVSTANAFALRGAHIVFVDIDPLTLCIDLKQVEQAITEQCVKVVITVHYAGISCDMEQLLALCNKHSVLLVEDAAQAYNSYYKDRRLGQIGLLGTLSFHETKNVIAGEGGCIIINNTSLLNSAEIIREKGTDRSLFMKGDVDKYTWREIGSSFLPGDLVAAFLFAQLESAELITDMRLRVWDRYYNNLSPSQASDTYQLQQIPYYATHNAHMFYLLCRDNLTRNTLLKYLRAKGVHAVFHYIPLHSSPAGLKYGSSIDSMHVTNRISDTIIRLPLYPDLSTKDIDYISSLVLEFFSH